jgi:cell wall-associated NlpC family hydrolase
VIYSDVEVLRRAHQLFVGNSWHPTLDAGTAPHRGLLQRTAGLNHGLGRGGYQLAADDSRQRLLSAAHTDAEAAAVIAGAHQDRVEAGQLTKGVLDAARADATATPMTPMAQREAVRRQVARLRTQRAHVLSARLRAHQHSVALRALRYRMMHHRGLGLRLPSSNGRAAIAVRAALSRVGRPYVWGATGPDEFDCSGLVQWSYAQAGVHLDRTTYQQINDGIPVPRSQVRPGDLVFPHAGHVQLAIGTNLVVEAPYSGASVRISPLGNNVAVRRPL